MENYLGEQTPNNYSPLSNYEILEKIGEGGYGVVFKAIQQSTGQTVAVKIMSAKENLQQKKQLTDRFERETQLCAQINHPNIVKLIDKGFTEDNAPFAVFEYVEGITLKDLIIQNNGLSPLLTAELMLQILDALTCIHALGIIHRDLKPSNIMVAQYGTAQYIKILDFGIGAFSKEFQVNDYKTLTLTKETLGTPSYSAPEQLRGEPATAKSDIYSWGLILLECLIGTPFIQGRTLAEIFKQQLDPTPLTLPSQILGHSLGDLLLRVLEKDHSKRIDNTPLVIQEYKTVNFNTIAGKISGQPSPFDDDEFDKTQINLPDNSWKKNIADQRQITVLCIKLSLSLSENTSIDHETLDTIQKDQLNLCVDTSLQFGGYIAGKITDHVIVYFGYPQVNDNDARRAGRTALVLASKIQKRQQLLSVQHGIEVEFRMSINAGTIISKPHITPEGVIPNTAFNMLYHTQPNSILVSSNSQKLLEAFLEFEKGNEVKLPNQHKFLQTYRLLGERGTEAYSFLRPWSAAKNIIGRDTEIDKLKTEWNRIQQKQKGKNILLQGQAGIGKSKLVHEYKSWMRKKNNSVFEIRCLPEYQSSALYPFFNLFKQQLEIKEDSKEATETIKAFLIKENLDVEITMPVICSWLSIKNTDLYPLSQASPEKQKEIIFNVLSKFIYSIAPEKGYTIIIEDLHWLDTTSLTFLDKIVDKLEESTLHLIMTARENFSPSWNPDCFECIEIKPLGNERVRDMVKALLEGQNISEEALEFITNKTDGIPLYIEEMARMLVEKSYLRQKEDTYHLINDIDKKSIPITLQDLLFAKIDNLGFAKETAQIAASIGREFNYQLLVKASFKEEFMIQTDLEALIKNGIVYPQRKINGENYIFHHALIRDASYNSIVKQQKKDIHRQIAEVIEYDFPELADNNPFELACHYAEAESFDKATIHGLKSAKNALDKSLNAETLGYIEKITLWANQVNGANERDAFLLNTYCFQTYALMNQFGWAADNVKSSVDKAFQQLQQIQRNDVSTESLISAYWALITYYHVASERLKVKTLTQEFLQIAEQINDENLILSAQVLVSIYQCTDGELEDSIHTANSIIDKLATNETLASNLTIGIDNLTYTYAIVSMSYWYAGKHQEAEEAGDKAIERARTINHTPSLCLALLYRGAAYQLANDKAKAQELMGEMLMLASQYGLVAFSAYGATIHHWSVDDVEALDQIIGQLEFMGCKLGLTYYSSLPARFEYEQGKHKEAIERIDKCLALCETNKEYYCKGMLLELKASFI